MRSLTTRLKVVFQRLHRTASLRARLGTAVAEGPGCLPLVTLLMLLPLLQIYHWILS